MNHEVIASYVPAGMPGAPEHQFQRKLLPALIAACFACGPVYANPTGAQVVSGQVSISSNGNVLTITNSPGSIINWSSFSINPGELTQFLQQSSSSAVLNRIVGQSPSQIFGALQSNGKVYLINPNGILFGANSRVNVGGLVASTLDISNSDFAAGKLDFAAGSTAGNIVNQGNLITPAGGQIYLIAPQVQNSGIISSPQGEVLLAAGHSVQLVDGADPNIQVVVSAPTDQAVNLGNIVAQGGRIGLYGALVNQSGVVSADSAVVGQDGQIVFKSSQATTLEGNSQTSATGSGSGGSIYLLGPQVALTGSAQVDASGQTGGGTVFVGGGEHGANPAIMNANTVTLGANTSIAANAIQSGNGGNIAVWSANSTSVAGFIETSGGQLAIVNGSNITTKAAHGTVGSWLLDPDDFTIAPTGGNMTGTQLSSDLNSNNVTINTTVTPTTCAGTTCTTGGIPGTNGDIYVSDTVTWTGSSILTLNAAGHININSPISGGTGSTLEMLAGGNITQATGGVAAISVTNLSASIPVSGTVMLAEPTNNITGTVAISAPGGDVGLVNSGPISIGSVIGQVGTVSGMTAGVLVELVAGGNITQASGAAINSNWLSATSTGGSITLTEPTNSFSAVAASAPSAGANISLATSGALNVQTINGNIGTVSGLTASGYVELNAGSDITQTGGVAISATNLSATSTGGSIPLMARSLRRLPRVISAWPIAAASPSEP